MSICPCHSQKTYSSCCKPFITGKEKPNTPEALMRSRYTAYTKADIDYIKATMRGNALIGFNETDAKRWAKKVSWLKLDVIKSGIDTTGKGHVEFIACFMDGPHLRSMHEKSEFLQQDGQWYYTGGELLDR